jgi:hypothetical protein
MRLRTLDSRKDTTRAHRAKDYEPKRTLADTSNKLMDQWLRKSW